MNTNNALTRKQAANRRANDRMSCGRCGHKVNIDKLQWSYIFVETRREFLLACPACRKDFGA